MTSQSKERIWNKEQIRMRTRDKIEYSLRKIGKISAELPIREWASVVDSASKREDAFAVRKAVILLLIGSLFLSGVILYS